MTFTRQRSDGTHETNLSETFENVHHAQLDAQPAPHAPPTDCRFLSFRPTSQSFKSIATFALTAFAITVPMLLPAQARYYSRYSKSRSYQKSSRTSAQKTNRSADEVTTGVWGWTKGSQTYLRVRPAATTPFVAKVPRHTKLFVWGKFNGWYRVETPDHIFGWVFHQYVNAPEDHKLKELSHAKAKVACDRSAKQLMYGSADMLQKYYATYRAPGAMRGLEKMGIRVASAKPKAKTVAARAHANQQKRARVAVKAAPKATVAHKATPRAVQAPAKPAPKKAVIAAAPAIPNANTLQPVAPVLIPVQKPVAAQKPTPAKPKVVAQRSTKKLASRSASNRPKQRHTSTRKSRKNVVAGVPPMKVSGMSPITPDDILRAREAHLGSRHKTQPVMPPAKLPARIEETPSTNDERATLQPSSTDAFTAPSLPSPLLAQSLTDAQQLPVPLTDVNGATRAITVVSLKKNPAAGSAKAKPANTKAAPNRGGSPRDYARYMQQKNSFGEGMATQALSYRGMPYIHGAASPRRGFDCSGLVYHLLRQRGYNPPRTAAGLASYGTPVPKDKLLAGDIVLFANTYRRGVSHVGVYCGNGRFVHAANRRAGVRVDALFSGYYGRKYYGARRAPVKK